MSKMTIVRGDDWEGIYINDKLMREGHSVEPFDAVKLAIEHGVSSVASEYCDLDWLHAAGNLPDLLSEVRLESQS
jgi:hypothetical protein